MFELLFNKFKKTQKNIQENKKEEYLEKITDTFYRYYDAYYKFFYILKKINNSNQNEAMWSLDLFLNGDKINLYRYYEKDNIFFTGLNNKETSFSDFNDVINHANNILTCINNGNLHINYNCFTQIHSGLYLYYLLDEDAFFILKKDTDKKDKNDGDFWSLFISYNGARIPVAHFATKSNIYHKYSNIYADIMQLSNMDLIVFTSEKMIKAFNSGAEEDEATFDKVNDFFYMYSADEALYILHYENIGVSGKGRAWVLDMVMDGAIINLTTFVIKKDAEYLVKDSYKQKCWNDIDTILPHALDIIFSI